MISYCRGLMQGDSRESGTGVRIWSLRRPRYGNACRPCGRSHFPVHRHCCSWTRQVLITATIGQSCSKGSFVGCDAWNGYQTAIAVWADPENSGMRRGGKTSRYRPSNQKGPVDIPGLSILIRQRPTFPRPCGQSIIGPGGLNFRVRNGNG